MRKLKWANPAGELVPPDRAGNTVKARQLIGYSWGPGPSCPLQAGPAACAYVDCARRQLAHRHTRPRLRRFASASIDSPCRTRRLHRPIARAYVGESPAPPSAPPSTRRAAIQPSPPDGVPPPGIRVEERARRRKHEAAAGDRRLTERGGDSRTCTSCTD